MKKTIFLLAGIALVTASFSLVAIARADNKGSELERILSPEHLKEFRVMKRVGDALYGIRLNAVDAATSTSSPLTIATTTSVNQKLEKIESPEFVHEYEQIRRIGTALWGLKKAEANISKGEDQGIGSSLALATITPDMISCVSIAITAKDQAVIAEVNAAATSLTAAITARGTCQQAALQTTGNQATALNNCVQVFKAASRQINQVAQQAQQEAWTAYTNSLKTCHVGGTVSTSTPATAGQSNGLMIRYDGGGDNVNSLINAGSDN
jgi:hypothetical protein